MFYEKFKSIIQSHGGQVSSFFHQDEHLHDLTVIQAGMIGSNQSTTVQSNFSAMDGVCHALALLMIEQKFNFPLFLSSLSTPEGKGKIRGYQQMMKWDSITKSGKCGYENPSEPTMSLIKHYRELGAIILGGLYTRTNINLIYGTIASSALFIQQHANHYFELILEGKTNSSHTLALANTANHYGFFDPNLGMGMFPKKGADSANTFCTCLDTIITCIYFNRTYEKRWLNAYKSKSHHVPAICIE